MYLLTWFAADISSDIDTSWKQGRYNLVNTSYNLDGFLKLSHS